MSTTAKSPSVVAANKMEIAVQAGGSAGVVGKDRRGLNLEGHLEEWQGCCNS